LNARDRLQPALLDRLMTETSGRAAESPDARLHITRAELRAAVLRDLGWLLNSVQGLGEKEVIAYPEAARSVLNYGLPALSGKAASRVDVTHLERAIRQAIETFEPRVLRDSLSVQALESDDVLGSHNVIEFEIRGLLWAQPMPLELLLRTQLDLEVGQVRVHDLLGAGVARQTDARGG